MPVNITRRYLVLSVSAISLVGALVLWQTSYWARLIALDQIGERSRHTLSLVIQTLRGDLDKYLFLPKLLSDSPTFRNVLRDDSSAIDLQMVNEELERINNSSGALDTFLMNSTGLTIAASDWASDNNLIGENFSDRSYFKAALEGRLGRDFALGRSSEEREYYFAYPVREGVNVIGAIVVKVPLGHHESAWQSGDQEVIVVDRKGVIFLSRQPDWRLKSLVPMSAEETTKSIISKRYSNQLIEPFPITVDGELSGNDILVSIMTNVEARKPLKKQYLAQVGAMLDTEWRVILLAQTKRVDAVVKMAIAGASILIISIILALTAFYQRRRRLADHIAIHEESNAQLELRVLERTNELTELNIDLQNEIGERERAEDEVKKTQATLVQAAKMAALGQMSAGLTHELNQPLAAIRSYADNARSYLDRNQFDTAKGNLKLISELTARMARIIRNLRTYAPEETIEMRPTSIRTVLDESLLMLGQRIKNESITVLKKMPAGDIMVMGGDVRLQQIFVNLISNAIDAMHYTSVKNININVSLNGEDVIFIMSDSGPGIQEDQIANIFDPFYSTKEVGRGMGLGLSVTLGLVNQFGGTISVNNSPNGGAEFTLRLKRGDIVKEAIS